jgi:hypothetical protein
MNRSFFPPRPELNPTIYVYELPKATDREGLLKIGFTNRDVKTRIKEQLGTAGVEYRILLEASAMREDGSSFSDHDIHRHLKDRGFENTDGEWFQCSLDDVKSTIVAIQSGEENVENRTLTFGMRPEQQEAVEKSIAYFTSNKAEDPSNTPHFLWNAKMHFGKTFATYQLAKAMGWRKILVLTFKPAVVSAWSEDLATHVDFEGWQFVSRDALSIEEVDSSQSFVCFGSFQDYLGKNDAGGIKSKNEWVHETHWDCVVFDEYHYGAWRESAKELFESEDKREQKVAQGEGIEYFDEENMPITTEHYLYLSGTPFRAISTGEFIEEQIFNWTYSDEQRAKEEWRGADNPYASLPRMVMLTYQMPDSIKEIAMGGEFNEFDLNTFFSAKGEDDEAEFVYLDYVQKWLDLIRGHYMETSVDNLKLGAKKPPMPFSDANLLSLLTHTFWFLPTVASCDAMKNLMMQKQNIFYHDYHIVVAAG